MRRGRHPEYPTADFNFRPDDPLYARLRRRRSRRRHANAMWIAGRSRIRAHRMLRPWAYSTASNGPEPFACDFIFVAGDLARRVREVRVNSDTDASDHQPVLLCLD